MCVSVMCVRVCSVCRAVLHVLIPQVTHPHIHTRTSEVSLPGSSEGKFLGQFVTSLRVRVCMCVCMYAIILSLSLSLSLCVSIYLFILLFCLSSPACLCVLSTLSTRPSVPARVPRARTSICPGEGEGGVEGGVHNYSLHARAHTYTREGGEGGQRTSESGRLGHLVQSS